MDSLELSIYKRPMEEEKKRGQVVHATRIGGRELGQWRGSLPSKAEPPKSGLQKWRGQAP